MGAQHNNTIIGNIITKAENMDMLNLSYENDIINRFVKDYDEKADMILNIASSSSVSMTLQYTEIIRKFEDIITNMNSSLYKILLNRINDYYEIGYNNMSKLIQLGNELEAKYKENISEFKANYYIDPEAVKYLRDHAYEYVKDLNNSLLSQMKLSMSSMLASGNWDRKKLEDDLYVILDKNRTRANAIAQTELSLAYNNGALNRLNDYNILNDRKMKKYWHGFKYSEVTCTYCRPRIGLVYDVTDNSESLPAHVKCRCLWLPFDEKWDKPISNIVYKNAETLKRVYSSDDIYRRLNERLNINYGSYVKLDDAINYLAGDRSDRFEKIIDVARNKKIIDVTSSFTSTIEASTEKLAKEFNNQMSFWKGYTAKLYTDNDMRGLESAKQGIKGVMILPWTPTQLTKWNLLLEEISKLF